MNLDRSLRASAPPTPLITDGIEREVRALAAVHAVTQGKRQGRFTLRLLNHKAALFGSIALILVGGASAATAAPTVFEFFQPLQADRTSAHLFSDSPDEDACVIEWTVSSADGSGVGEDTPAVIAAREYLLSLDLTTVGPDPRHLKAAQNTEGMEGPARSEQEMVSMALMSTVWDLVAAELKSQGFDEGGVFLHTSTCEW